MSNITLEYYITEEEEKEANDNIRKCTEDFVSNVREALEFWEDENMEYYKTAYFDPKSMTDIG